MIPPKPDREAADAERLIYGCKPIRGTIAGDATSVAAEVLNLLFELPLAYGPPKRAVAWSRQRDQQVYAAVVEWDFAEGQLARRIEFWLTDRQVWLQRTVKFDQKLGACHSSITMARVLS